MKKLAVLGVLLLLASCATKQVVSGKRPLFEVLTQQETGGGNIQFYEILTEQKEIVMLQGDENLKNKIKPGDTDKCNFVILNMGEKRSGGYSITVESATETADKVILKVKEKKPEPGSMVTEAITYPYAVVRINSKKAIEIQ
ncbi:MAG: protease complex subunit PrcB family protein [Flavobacterium sp.]|nr:MAG: protease complex subunit PrcB family protein [Flavobacterium sp.]